MIPNDAAISPNPCNAKMKKPAIQANTKPVVDLIIPFMVILFLVDFPCALILIH